MIKVLYPVTLSLKTNNDTGLSYARLYVKFCGIISIHTCPSMLHIKNMYKGNYAVITGKDKNILAFKTCRAVKHCWLIATFFFHIKPIIIIILNT